MNNYPKYAQVMVDGTEYISVPSLDQDLNHYNLITTTYFRFTKKFLFFKKNYKEVETRSVLPVPFHLELFIKAILENEKDEDGNYPKVLFGNTLQKMKTEYRKNMIELLNNKYSTYPVEEQIPQKEINFIATNMAKEMMKNFKEPRTCFGKAIDRFNWTFAFGELTKTIKKLYYISNDSDNNIKIKVIEYYLDKGGVEKILRDTVYIYPAELLQKTYTELIEMGGN